MIVVLASRFDTAARDLVHRWPSGGARLLTADDLTTAGWQWLDGAQDNGRAIVSGQLVNCKAIRGVLTRRPAILPQELTAIAEADRAYVAAEITAFLTAWLSSLTCPVVNRPRGGCLSGPNWTIERWLMTAARLGINVRPSRRTVPAQAPSGGLMSDERIRVTVVGSEIIGIDDQPRANATRLLAQAAGVELLDAYFQGRELIGATCSPDLSDPSIFEALTRRFNGAGT